MMRCWECKRLIVVPERVTPEGKYPQAHTEVATCRSCGAIYDVTTTRKPGRMIVTPEPPTEGQKERDRVWKG